MDKENRMLDRQIYYGTELNFRDKKHDTTSHSKQATLDLEQNDGENGVFGF